MKAILMSIKPEWCEKIFSGEKTIEVRKVAPKPELPFKVYVYCTKSGMRLYGNKNYYVTDMLKLLNGSAIKAFENSSGFYSWNGKVIGEFVCDEIYVRPANVIYYGKGQEDYLDLLKSACMTEREVLDYMGGQFNRDTYFWHVTDLKIYDKPKELHEFRAVCKKGKTKPNKDCRGCTYAFKGVANKEIICDRAIMRAPRTWVYVEEIEEWLNGDGNVKRVKRQRVVVEADYAFRV